MFMSHHIDLKNPVSRTCVCYIQRRSSAGDCAVRHAPRASREHSKKKQGRKRHSGGGDGGWLRRQQPPCLKSARQTVSVRSTVESLYCYCCCHLCVWLYWVRLLLQLCYALCSFCLLACVATAAEARRWWRRIACAEENNRRTIEGGREEERRRRRQQEKEEARSPGP